MAKEILHNGENIAYGPSDLPYMILRLQSQRHGSGKSYCSNCFCFCNSCSNIDSVSEPTSQHYEDAGDHNDAVSLEVKWVMLRNKKLQKKFYMRTVQDEMKGRALSEGYC